METIDWVVKHSTRHTAQALDPDLGDLEFIESLVERLRPKRIMEYGSGWSTLVIGETLKRLGYGGSIKSVETDKDWWNLSKSDVYNMGLSQWVSSVWDTHLLQIDVPYRYGEDTESTRIWEHIWQHSVTPCWDCDFLYVDGPELTDNCRITFNNDMLHVPVILVDGRQETVDFLKQRLPHSYIEDKEQYRSLFIL
mgnify:CR=1 FL=1|jgi:hypothetical protein